MARFTVFSQDGTQARYSGTPVYHGTFLKPAYLEFREIASHTIIPWQIGDYVDYHRTGYRYKLYSVPYPTKQAVSHAAGDSFVYRDVQFFCATKDLEIAPFRDLVISDNSIHFTTLPNVATFEDVFGIARRIQANMDAFYGEGVWEIRVVDTNDPEIRAVLLETKEFSLSDGTCLDALSCIYDNWRGMGWVYSVENGRNVITIGRPNIQEKANTTGVFAYGIGNGLTLIKKDQSGKNDLATRIYAYGSTRNLVARYYNNITPSIKDAQSVYIPNLMIPPSTWGETGGLKDARKAYVEAEPPIVAKYGLRPKTVYFDGSGDYEEIYPSVETLTAGQIRGAMAPTDDYYPSATFAPDSKRMDEVSAAANPADDGVIATDDGKKYVQTVSLLGVSGQYTYAFKKGQESAKIPLTNITVANTITATGKVLVTPSFQMTVASGVNLATVSVRLWVEIGGVKYGNAPCSYTKSADGIYTVTMPPFEINTEDTGSVIFTGYLFAAPSNRDSAFNLSYTIQMGTTTLEVAIVPADTFKVEIPQIGFDISKQQSAVSGGLCTIAFKTGWCAGREFTVRRCEYQQANDRWVLTVARHNDESIGQYFPNAVYRIAPGDRYVLIDMTMPEIYITTAQQRLLERAQAVLNAMSTPKIIYEPEIDAKVMARSGETLVEGMYMPLQDDDLVEEEVTAQGQRVHREWVLIDTLEINEGESTIPTYRVTLQDEKRESFFARLTRETGRTNRSITEIELKDLRTDVEELEPTRVHEEEVSVEVVSSHPIIGYEHSFDEEPVNDVTLTCRTTGIDNPSYQWYFRGKITWVAIPEATDQSYVVDPDSEYYYRDGEIVEDFRCVVNDNPDYTGEVQIMKVLANAITVSLSNPAHIFTAGVKYAIAAEDRSDVVGYRGVDRFATNVKMSGVRFLDAERNPLNVRYSGGRLKDSRGRDLTTRNGEYLVVASGSGAVLMDASGENEMIIVSVENNGTTDTYIVVSVTGHLNIPSGVIEIPVIVRDADAASGSSEKVVNLYYSWGLALQGNSSFTSIVFRRSARQPERPTGGDFENPVPEGWSDGIPPGDNTLWMSMRIFSANGQYPQEDEWSTPTGAFDTADVDFEWSTEEEIPTVPHPGYDPSHDTTPPVWHNDSTDAIWMAIRKKAGGIWGSWEVFRCKGEDGRSPIFADLSNEADGISVGSDGILDVAMTLSTKVSLWYGTDADTISGIIPTIPNAFNSKVHVTFPGGISTGQIQIVVDAGTDFRTTSTVNIQFLVTGTYGSRTVTYTIVAIREGEDGHVFTLVPDHDFVTGRRGAGNTVTYTPTAVKVARYTRSGSGGLVESTYGQIRYSVDGGTRILADYNPGSGVAVYRAVAASKIIFYWYSSGGSSGVMIDRETIPIIADGANGADGADGADGYSSSTIYLYQRAANGAPAIAPGNTTYDFATGVLSPASGASLNGWQQTIPSGIDPCYVTMFFAQANTATISIPGGWTTAGGSWAAPTRLTGENGLRGKVMRGINPFSQQYGAGVKTQTVVNYQGLDDTDTSHVYYDMVYTESVGTRTYYYCKVESLNGVLARNITPGTNPAVWVQATQFDFVATRVLLASNAFIDILSGNGVYMYDDGMNYIVAGVQGGTGVNFFAGTRYLADGSVETVLPSDAAFRVMYSGKVYAADIEITGGSIVLKDGNTTNFLVTNKGKLTANDATILGSIEASGNNFDVTGQSGAKVAIKSNNGLWVMSGTTYLQALVTAGTAYMQSIVATGTISARATTQNAQHSIEASYGNYLAKLLVSAVAGSVELTAQDATRSVVLTLFGGDLTLKRGDESYESVVTSPIIKHAITISESNYDALSPAEKNDPSKVYFVT